MHHSKQIQQLQAELAIVHAKIHKLQQENTFLRKHLAPKSSITDILPSLSGCITSPNVSSLSRNSPTHLRAPHRLSLLSISAVIPNLV
jgi:hypothetical protein